MHHSNALSTFNEVARLDALRAYRVLDTVPEQAFDDLTTLAASVCAAPTALVSFVDQDRVWFKSRVGFDAREIKREFAFCSHAILAPDGIFEVVDASRDGRFDTNPLVTGRPGIRFYAGAALLDTGGLPVGTICVIDDAPRRLLPQERAGLASLARQVVAQLELRREVLKLGHEAGTDPLTGASNRRAFDRRLKAEWSSHARHARPMSLLLLDIDHFKSLNDEFGHAAGDEVLVEVARRINLVLRGDDVLFRHGGEEFTVMLPRTDLQGALTVAEKVRASIAGSGWAYRPITASVGAVSTLPRLGDDPYTAVAQVDRAMYTAKNDGRNCVRSVEGNHRLAA